MTPLGGPKKSPAVVPGILAKRRPCGENRIQGTFDTITFSVRGWAVSAFTAMLAVSASQKLPNLMLLAILPVVMFWLVDALIRVSSGILCGVAVRSRSTSPQIDSWMISNRELS